MIAGDPFKRAYTDDFAGQAVSFVCLDYDGVSTQGYNLPNKTCPDGLRAQVFFPSCWDGVNLDSADHKSHMAYPTKYSYDNGPCPASHPVHMISIFYEVIYSTDGFDWWNGTQQPFVFAQGDPTGYGYHGDFINGWDVDVLQNATDRCTSDTGLIEDCDVFEFFTTAESQACIIAPEIDEQVMGTLDALPGCNPVQWGPSEAIIYNNCGDNATIGAATSYSTDVSALGWTYIGCGTDVNSNRTFSASQWYSDSMTVEGCVKYCQGKGYSLAGLEYQSQCYCSNTLAADRAPVDGVLGNCFSTCAGNSSEYCGGSSRLSMYNQTSVVSLPSSTKSSSSASATATGLSCPASNSTTYTSSNGAKLMVECGLDRAGSDLGMVYVSGIQGCLDACANATGCVSVSLSGAACYMHSTLEVAKVASGIQGGRLISSATGTVATASASSTSKASSSSTSKTGSVTSTSTLATSTSKASSSSKTSTSSSASASASTLSCPGSNSTTYTASTGSKFVIECGIDHSAGDMGMVYVSNFQGCVEACATTTGCVDVSLSGAACYMKKTLGKALYSNSGILGARLVTSSSTSSATATATATKKRRGVHMMY